MNKLQGKFANAKIKKNVNLM